jgi:hypothetical protein
MKVFDVCSCRLGNALFRYMASSLFCIIYNGDRTYNESECNSVISEDYFKHWCNNIMNSNTILEINKNLVYKFPDFYQTDIYKLYKYQLIEWFDNHKEDTVFGENTSVKYKIGDLLDDLDENKKYDIVIHLRLEDFLETDARLIIHPESICNIINELNSSSMCIVCNKPKTEIEKIYIDYIKNKNKNKNIIFESNDVITDFKIIKSANILICGISTMAWVAGFLSKQLKLVYFPKNKYPGWVNQTFSTIIENTVFYDNELCNKNDLEFF